MLVKIILCVIILLSTAETKYSLKQVTQFWKLKQCILPFETLSLNKTEPKDHPFLKPCFEKPRNEVCDIFVNFTIQVCKAIGNNTALINHYRPLIGSAIVDQVNNVQPICSLAKEKNLFILKYASYMANSSYCEAQCKDTMNLCSLLVLALCSYQEPKYCQQSSSQGLQGQDKTPQVTKELPLSATPVATTTTTPQTTANRKLTSTLSLTTKMATSNEAQNKSTTAADTSKAGSITTNNEKTTGKFENDKKIEESKTAQEPKQDKTNTQTKGTERVENEKQTEESKTAQEPKQDKTNTQNAQTEGTEKHTGTEQGTNTDGDSDNSNQEPLENLDTADSDDLGVTGKKPKGQADDSSRKEKQTEESKTAQEPKQDKTNTQNAQTEGTEKHTGTEQGTNTDGDSNNSNQEPLENLDTDDSDDLGVTGKKPKGQADESSRKEKLNQSGLSVDDEDESYSSGHFIAYFLSAVIICVAGYIIFHNKQKIMAFVIEGRSAHQRRQRSKGVKYTELKSNVEEVMPSLEKTATAKNFVY
ncbi:trans-Golgi network integral membrane protein 1 [Biomphalaria pfeifferi]|uniref:Trans-Golgi network integral membrane protein 1 n=1 Tax=Biomphalaria pfeifferi TaxID=112525 RepID=A0AAD8F1P6_BIOPF|nr:trans-Golgi network integral membrane protein 1 [Biomphalaria pfeifferi]